MPLTRSYLPEDLASFPDDGSRYETVHGQLLVTPAAGRRHQPVVTRLMMIFAEYLRLDQRVEELLTAPADVHLGTHSLVQPDVIVADTRQFLQSGDWRDINRVHLAVEIISPSSRLIDRTIKRDLYRECGVTARVVDIEAGSIEVARPHLDAVDTHRGMLRWQHPEMSQECVLDVAELLRFERRG